MSIVDRSQNYLPPQFHQQPPIMNAVSSVIALKEMQEEGKKERHCSLSVGSIE
jgi:hypothetical protein